MRKRKLLLLSIAATTIVSIPIATVISCGDASVSFPPVIIDQNQGQKKMDGITKLMVTAEVRNHLNPDTSQTTPTIPPKDWHATLNGLTTVNIHVKNWVAAAGSPTMTIVISKGTLIASGPFDVTISGYAISKQQKFNSIKSSDVANKIRDHLQPTINTPIPLAPRRWTVELNGIKQIIMKISNWLPKSDGSVTMKATLAASGLTSPPPFIITITGFQSTDQANMSKITESMVITAVKDRIGAPNAAHTTAIPNEPNESWTHQFGVLSGVNITISNWVVNNNGTVDMGVAISKDSLIPPGPFHISIAGYESSEQTKMSAIDNAAVQSAIIKKLNPNSATAVPTIPSDIEGTVGELEDAIIHIKIWTPGTDGTVTGGASVSKGSLIPRTSLFSFTLVGYKTTKQAEFNNITKQEVHDVIKNQLNPSSANVIPNKLNDFVAIIHRLTQINVVISNWVPNDDGSISMDATISHVTLGSKTFPFITVGGYKTASQVKMDEVSKGEVRQIVKNKLNVDYKVTVPVRAIPKWTANINGLEVDIEITSWTPGTDGSVALTTTLTDPYNVLTPPGPYSFTIHGYKTKAQAQFDSIQSSDVKAAITLLLAPSKSNVVPNQPSWPPVTVGKANNVQMNINQWTDNTDGSVTMDISAFAAGTVGTKTFQGITIEGFKASDQAKLDVVSATDIINAITNKIGNAVGSIPDKPANWKTRINGVSGVTIALTGWTKNAVAGSIVTSAVVSRADLKSPPAFPITITGYSKKDQQQAKLDAITTVEAKKAIVNKLVPLKSKNVLRNAPNKWEIQFGTLDKVGITLSAWNTDTAGSVTMTAILSKDGLKSKVITGITIGGFGHTLKLISAIPVEVVDIPDVHDSFSQQIDATHYLIGTYDKGVYQVTVDANGMVTKYVQVPLSAIPDVRGGWSQKISATHYLIGTRKKGVYQVTVDSSGMVSQALQVSMNGNHSIPTVQDGWSQKINPTHYLIGTNYLGVYQVTVNTSGIVTKSIRISRASVATIHIPDVGSGCSQQIDNTHYLIGTLYEGVYQVTVDPTTGMATKTVPVPLSTIPSVGVGFIQQINTTHYLVGTHANGVYQVTVDADGMVTKSTQVSHDGGDNSLPDVQNGFSQQIDPKHYLIGTQKQGVYQVIVDPTTGMVTTTTRIPIEGSNSIPSVSDGFIQRIDDTHYLIGTESAGVYQVYVSYLS